eukprot:COSAG04_NODE_3235_length_3018_cov_5.967455_4_plen_141_part_00
MRQGEPLELVSAHQAEQPGFRGWALCALKDIVEGAQAAARDAKDLTRELLESGLIDRVLEALEAAMQAVDTPEPWSVVYILWLLALLDGKHLPQIEDKLRPKAALLRHFIDHDVIVVEAFGLNSMAFGTIVAGAACGGVG